MPRDLAELPSRPQLLRMIRLHIRNAPAVDNRVLLMAPNVRSISATCSLSTDDASEIYGVQLWRFSPPKMENLLKIDLAS